MIAAEEMTVITASDAVRTYIRSVRLARDVSQDALARYIGLSLRAYTEWEAGRTKSIKTRPLMRAVDYLAASADHIKDLIAKDSGDEEAQRLANELVAQIERLPPEEREARRRQAVALIDELLADPAKLDRWLGYGARLLEEENQA